MQVDCKHCAALIFHLLDESVDSPASLKVHLNRELERWLHDIPAAVKHTDEPQQAMRLVYRRKDTSTAGKWALEICKAGQLKSGELQDINSQTGVSLDACPRHSGASGGAC
ncbi:hypothetical protein GIW70_04400 [Pseudomonas syringae]|nr:hypothetical protein [Pseudomonas syringae]MCF5067438.1 hypothetical protein [Pseudomonas syringae]